MVKKKKKVQRPIAAVRPSKLRPRGNDDVLTTDEAAHTAKVSVEFMREVLADGSVDGHRRPHPGRGGHRVLRADLIAWVGRGMPRSVKATEKPMDDDDRPYIVDGKPLVDDDGDATYPSDMKAGAR